MTYNLAWTKTEIVNMQILLLTNWATECVETKTILNEMKKTVT